MEHYAYTHKEVLEMISSLRGRAATVVALAGLTGLRLGEIRGLKCQDFDGESLAVSRSVWRTQIRECFPLRGERKGAPLNLANLVHREMSAIVEKGKWLGWHGFRRGVVTSLHKAQVQVEVIRGILQHTDPKVVLAQ